MTTTNKNNGFKDTYRQVTDFVMEQLEKGEIVWRKGWNSKGLPKNIITGVAYRGWNVFFLNFVTLQKEYPTPFFLTFRQAQKMGGHIRKGEKGVPIVYWAKIEAKKNGNGVEDTTAEAETKIRLVPRQYTVFNIAQTEGIEFPEAAGPGTIVNSLAACDAIVQNMPNVPPIQYKGDEAWYSLKRDIVNMPEKHLFNSSEELYSTLFHELAHATGHTSRLNRKELMETDGFGNERYSKEELTAEMTAGFLCAISGIEQKTLTNSAAYIKGWLQSLQNDKTLVVKAAAQAQKAADYILNRQVEESAFVAENTAQLITQD